MSHFPLRHSLALRDFVPTRTTLAQAVRATKFREEPKKSVSHSGMVVGETNLHFDQGLTPLEGRCLHQYFYLQHPLFGFMQLRVQTWAPFTVHVNINGRERLAGQLRQAGVSFEKRDNCFVDMGDVPRAQALLDEQLRPHSDGASGDLVLHSVNQVGCQNVLHYLGRRGLVTQYPQAEITTSVLTRHEGTRCKHSINANSIKMHDKQETVLRIETTINQTREMTVFRPTESAPNGPPSWQRLRKGVADLHRRAHHLIKKVSRTHRYLLTEKGRLIITAILAAQNASTKQLAALAA